MSLKSCKELRVWQVSMDLVMEAYRIASLFPAEEKYGLKVQVQRSAVSIPANIAEGYGRSHLGDYLHHLSIAMGSLQELDTYIEIVRRLKLLAEGDLKLLLQLIESVGRMLTRLIQSLTAKH